MPNPNQAPSTRTTDAQIELIALEALQPQLLEQQLLVLGTMATITALEQLTDEKIAA